MKKTLFGLILGIFLLLPSVVLADTALEITSSVLDASIRPGSETTLSLIVKNPSSTQTITNVKLILTSGPHLSVSQSTLTVGALDSGKSQETSVTVDADRTAVSTTSYIKVKATYNTGSSSRETNINVPITITRVPILQIVSTEFDEYPEPGATVNMILTISNNGDGPAKDIELKLNQTTSYIGDSLEAFISEVPIGSEKNVSFKLTIAPATEIGTYSIPVDLSYLDETRSTSYREEKDIGFKVSGDYRFIVSLENQEILAPETTGKITIKIANAGTGEAKFLVASVENADPSEIYIGDIASDDYETEEFTVTIPSSTNTGKYTTIVTIEYKDNFGTELSEEFPININIVSKDAYAAINNPFSIINIIAIIVVIGVLYFGYRRYKKKKQAK